MFFEVWKEKEKKRRKKSVCVCVSVCRFNYIAMVLNVTNWWLTSWNTVIIIEIIYHKSKSMMWTIQSHSCLLQSIKNGSLMN